MEISIQDIKSKKQCNHDFREFWKVNYFGMLKLKEVKCIYCGKLKLSI